MSFRPDFNHVTYSPGWFDNVVDEVDGNAQKQDPCSYCAALLLFQVIDYLPSEPSRVCVWKTRNSQRRISLDIFFFGAFMYCQILKK